MSVKNAFPNQRDLMIFHPFGFREVSISDLESYDFQERLSFARDVLLINANRFEIKGLKIRVSGIVTTTKISITFENIVDRELYLECLESIALQGASEMLYEA